MEPLSYDEALARIQSTAEIGKRHFDEGAWHEAADALLQGTGLLWSLVQAGPGRSEKRQLIRRYQWVGRYCSYSYAQLEMGVNAACTIEASRALLLAEARDIAAAAPFISPNERTPASIAASLYREAALSGIEGAEDAAFKALCNEIRMIQGLERFLQPRRMSDIRAAAPDGPVVYIVPTSAGTVALIVRASGPVEILQFPDTDATIGWEVNVYLRAYQARSRGLSPEERRQNKSQWRDVLEGIGDALGSGLMGSIGDSLSSDQRVTLIPAGSLGCLPLHAARRRNSDWPGGYQYLVDRLSITYAASAVTLRAVNDSRSVSDSVIVVDASGRAENGKPVLALPAAHAEAVMVLHLYPGSTLLSGSDVTKERLLTEFEGRPALLHYAGHAIADTHDPLLSGLVLPNGLRLTLGDLQRDEVFKLGFVVLSACESSMLADLDVLDEVIGLAAGFLGLGAGAVLANQWAVPDHASLILMYKYYDALAGGADRAYALALSQRWLRQSSAPTLRQTLAEIANRLGSRVSGIENLLIPDGSDMPYSHPADWAAGTYWH